MSDIVTKVALQSDGKILVGEDMNHYDPISFPRLLRLNSNGTYDDTFSQDGFTINGSIRSILIQPDEKILIGGSFIYNNIFYLARLQSQPALGGYKVECLYGDGTTFGAADTCTKNIVVRESTIGNEVQ